MTEPFAELAREIKERRENYNGPVPQMCDVLAEILKPRLAQAARKIARRNDDLALCKQPRIGQEEIEQILNDTFKG